MGNKVTILDSFIKEIDSRYAVSPYWYISGFDEYYSQVFNFIKEAYGKEDAAKLSSIIDEYDNKRSLGIIRGYLLGLIAKDDISQVQKNTSVKFTAKENNDQHEKKVVFIVHGHDVEVKETVARFIEKLGLKTIILHEQPNSGKTIIEKFESFADKIAYAVVLLTPDDFGAARSNANKPKLRARQNVIFELGFFVAKLGRERVAALRKGDIELPSDYLGVIYTSIDSDGAWKTKLAKEMKTVGLEIDLNNAL